MGDEEEGAEAIARRIQSISSNDSSLGLTGSEGGAVRVQISKDGRGGV